jgi:hypothetical protein
MLTDTELPARRPRINLPALRPLVRFIRFIFDVAGVSAVA